MKLETLVRLVLPPIFQMVARKVLVSTQLAVRRVRQKGSLRERPCHYNELFVRHNGEVYPCCRTWNRPEMKIGHLDDPDLTDKIRDFSAVCACGEYRLRHSHQGERQNYQLLNMELSLACQGSCVMCCVGAPKWKGSYHLYRQLSDLVAYCRPSEILLQGGEVLIQKPSLDWVASLREQYGEDLRISLVSNGNVDADMAYDIARLFNRVTLSFVGYQEETYRAIMGMEASKAKSFAENLSSQGTSIYLKFLVTPINIHEAGIFLNWAATLQPEKIEFAMVAIDSYINKDTADQYWEKICSRASDRLKEAWLRNNGRLLASRSRIVFFEESANLFGVNEAFIVQNGLEESYLLNLR